MSKQKGDRKTLVERATNQFEFDIALDLEGATEELMIHELKLRDYTRKIELRDKQIADLANKIECSDYNKMEIQIIPLY